MQNQQQQLMPHNAMAHAGNPAMSNGMPYQQYGYGQNQSQFDPAMAMSMGVSDQNMLVTIATPLLTLITQIKHTVDHPNVPMLKAQIVEEVKQFERKLASANYPARTIAAARYAVCTAIDEAVLSRPWGTNSIWVQESLLSLFHKETWGGERFYIILEDMLRDIRGNIDFIEFIYFLMSLGYEGKFHSDANRAAREEIRNRVFYRIRQTRMKPEKILSPHWQNTEPLTTDTDKKRRLKRAGLVTVILLVAVGLFYNIRVYEHAKPVLKQLDAVGSVSPITTFSQVIQRPIIIRNDNSQR